MKRLYVVVLFLVLSFSVFSQTGPGGVGNSDGSSGQAENVLWLDANYLTLNNDDPVASWTDRSGNLNHATQGVATRQPLFKTNVINGFPIIYFEDIGGGVEDYMDFDGSLIVNTDFTVFYVGARRDNGENIVLGGTTESCNENLHFGWRNTTDNICNHWCNDIYSTLSGDGSTYVGDGDATDDYGMFMNRLGSTEANPQRRVFQNGTQIGSLNNSTRLASYGGSGIARWRATARYYNINVAEIIFYTKALNSAERIIVENYLAQKYNITIATDYYNPIAGYSYDIVGIGEESDGEQSESSSAGMYLTALGGLNVGDYIFTSHNDSTNSSATFRTDAEVTAAGSVEAYNRIWYLDTVGTPAAQLAFDFGEALSDGLNPTNISNYALLYRAGETGNFTKVKNADGLINGDQVYFNLTDVDLNTGYYTLGTEDDVNSPLEGITGRTWYTLISGNWDDWEVWTLDPSGALPNNPDQYTPTTSPTNTADDVVILTGRTVTDTSDNLTHNSLLVEGRLDLTTSTGHSFGTISGTGRILMAADNFPAGDASHFYTEGQGEGTVVYYGGDYDLSTAREFYDVEIELDNTTDTVRLLNDYTINGNLSFIQGNFKINDTTDDQLINLSVGGDVSVAANAGVFVGTGNPFATDNYQIGGTMPADDGKDYHDVFHQFIMEGNFTNYGIVRLTNLNAPDYNSLAVNGAVTVRFEGAANANANLYNTTDFYNLIIDKGTDKTYKVNLYSDNTSYFQLFGANSVGRTQSAPYSGDNPQIRKALWVYHGTLQLSGNIDIPTLSEGADEGGNGDYAIGKNARLWMDGSNVTVYSTASNVDQITGFTSGDTYTADGVNTGSGNQAMSVYGEFKLSDGTFGTRNSAGFIFWADANAQVKIEGGVGNVAQMRSASGGSGIASYIQTGGQFVVRGNRTEAGEVTGGYPLFGLESTEAVFSMSGGELLIQDISGNANGDFYLNIADGNYNVTGGTVTVEVEPNDTCDFYSTANIWDLKVKRYNDQTANSGVFRLLNDLVVSNDLTIETPNTVTNTSLDVTVFLHDSSDVTIGRNFTIERGARYEWPENGGTNWGAGWSINTTTFNGSEDGTLYFTWHDDPATGEEQNFWNFVVDKSNGASLTIAGDEATKDMTGVLNRSIKPHGELRVENGTLNQGNFSVRAYGDIINNDIMFVYEHGVTPDNANLRLRPGNYTIQSGTDAVFGLVKFNPTDGSVISLSNDAYIKRINYHNGTLYLGTHNLKVDHLYNGRTDATFRATNANVARMFVTDGNESDGGLSLLVQSNRRYTFPLGLGTDGVDVTSGGNSKYTPTEMIVTNFADTGYVQISLADEILGTTDPGGGTILSYYWRVRYSDFGTGNEPTVEYDFYYNESDDDSGDENQFVPGYVLDENPFTRNTDGNNAQGMDETNNIINFDNGGAGHNLVRANYTAGRGNRFNGPLDLFYSIATGSGDWDQNSSWHVGSPTGPQNDTPTDGSIVKIMGTARINVRTAAIADIALLEFENTNTSPTSENVGRVQFHVNGTYDLGSVRDTGMISFDARRTINMTADFGDFGSTLESYFLYFGGGDNTLTNIPTPIPNLMLESGTKRIGEDISVGRDFILNSGGNTMYLENDIDIARDMVVGVWGNGSIAFPAAGPAVTVEVGRNIDFSQIQNSDNRNLIVENGGDGSVEHTLILHGDINQSSRPNNTIDLYNGDNLTKVILELQGETNNSYYRTSDTVPDFYRIIMNKGNNQDYSFTFSDDFTLSGNTDTTSAAKALYLENGTLILDDPDINIDLSTGDEDFKIPSTTCLQVSQGKVNVSGDDNGIWLDGKLLIVGGTVDMINGTGNGNNYIEYSSSANSQLQISSGNLWVGSQIRRGLITEEGILSYNQSGGNVQVGVNAGGDNERGLFEILNTGSAFRHSAGELFIVNDYRSGASIASMYFDPDTVSLSSNTEIKFGDTLTTAGNGDFSIYAGQNLRNLTVDSINSPTLTLDIVELTLNEDLTIRTSSVFDANGLNLNMNGDFVNRGTFTANQNNTYFLGSTAQQITGTTTFWNLYKTTTNSLTLNDDIDVDNELEMDVGTFNDGDNTLSVQGNVTMDIIHTWGGSSDGILMNGSSQQVLTGDGTFGKLSVNNSAGVFIPQGNEFTIDGALQLEAGVLDIGKNLFVLDEDAIIIEQNAFSETNMIQTNISFTDAGVKKYYPAIVPADNFNFIYPIGSEGKYTPVELDIDAVDAGGFIRVKGANEMHPTITNDTEPCNEIQDTANVLKYHWLMEASSITGFDASVNMKYYIDDYQENSAFYDVTHYIAARLLWGSTLWNKYDESSFDETNQLLRFTFANADDNGISGDYTAGIEDQAGTCEGAIPDEVPAYITIKNGDWTDNTVWDTYPVSGGTVPSGGPRGAQAIVQDTVTIPSNYILSYKTTIDTLGMVKVGSTFGHRLGIVDGTGTLQLENGSLPAGIYDDFFSRSGGTIEFTGSTDYDVLSEVTTVRNLKFTGTGERRLPNLDFEVYGLLTIAGDDATLEVINEHDRNMTLDSNVVFTQGSYDAGVGTSRVIINGSYSQTITGDFTGTNAFWILEMDNSNGLTLAGDVEVDTELEFTSGIITTSAANILTIDNSAETTAVTGYSSSNYVDGPMRKLINTGDDFIFPVGDAGRYGQVVAISTATTAADYWEAEYYNANPHDFPMDTSLREANLEMVSGNEYWRIEGPAGDSSQIRIRWDDQSVLPAMTSDRVNNMKITEWFGGQWIVVDGTVTDGGVNSGTILSNYRVDLDEHYFTLGTYESAPLPTATFTNNDTSICAGQSVTLSIDLTGAPDWNVTIEEGGDSHTFAPQATSPLTFSVDSAGTYTITAVSDNNGAGVPFGPDVTVTVVPIPTAYNVTPTPVLTPDTAYCAGGSGIAIGLDDSDLGVNYQLLVDGNPIGGVVAGTNSAISFGNQTTAGVYTVEATDASGTCTQTMTGSTTISIDPAPVLTLTIDPLLDTICDGQNTSIDLNLTAGTAPYTFTISDGTDTYNGTSGADDPYIPAGNMIPVWVTGGGALTTYTYTVTLVTDSKGCSNVGDNTVNVVVYKVPETGPQYHISNTWQ